MPALVVVIAGDEMEGCISLVEMTDKELDFGWDASLMEDMKWMFDDGCLREKWMSGAHALRDTCALH